MSDSSSKTKSAATPSTDNTSVIRRGEVAEFFRKRTQLVGFSMELHKFTQYCAEFSDNALDALETFYWDQVNKTQKRKQGSLILPKPPGTLNYSEIPRPLKTSRRP
ncbi:MAG: hypothetical protein ACFFBU_10080, partial [Promethearchaeota archaeon]